MKVSEFRRVWFPFGSWRIEWMHYPFLGADFKIGVNRIYRGDDAGWPGGRRPIGSVYVKWRCRSLAVGKGQRMKLDKPELLKVWREGEGWVPYSG